MKFGFHVGVFSPSSISPSLLPADAETWGSGRGSRAHPLVCVLDTCTVFLAPSSAQPGPGHVDTVENEGAHLIRFLSGPQTIKKKIKSENCLLLQTIHGFHHVWNKLRSHSPKKHTFSLCPSHSGSPAVSQPWQKHPLGGAFALPRQSCPQTSHPKVFLWTLLFFLSIVHSICIIRVPPQHHAASPLSVSSV